MKKLLSRFLKWKSDDATPPKRVASAHEIAIKHVATRLPLDRMPETLAEVPNGNASAVEPVEPKDRRSRKRQGQRMVEAKVATSLMSAAGESEKERRGRQKRGSVDARDVEDVKPRRKSKKRRESFSYI